jgi:hypothetical protein
LPQEGDDRDRRRTQAAGCDQCEFGGWTAKGLIGSGDNVEAVQALTVGRGRRSDRGDPYQQRSKPAAPAGAGSRAILAEDYRLAVTFLMMVSESRTTRVFSWLFSFWSLSRICFSSVSRSISSK